MRVQRSRVSRRSSRSRQLVSYKSLTRLHVLSTLASGCPAATGAGGAFVSRTARQRQTGQRVLISRLLLLASAARYTPRQMLASDVASSADRAVAPEDARGRWAPFRLRPYDRICAQWLILHKVDNNDQMRCATRGPRGL